jgi:hypothetical protein
MAAEWTPEEDCQPGFPFLRQQPEQTEHGSVWTQIVSFQIDELPLSYTQMRLRLIAGQLLLSHGRVYPVIDE